MYRRYAMHAQAFKVEFGRIALVLVKSVVRVALVELHEGSVVLESCEGEGSRFTVRLPMSEAGDPVRLGDADRFLNDNFTRGRSRRR